MGSFPDHLFSCSQTTWDPQFVLKYICGLGPTENLSYPHLSRKLIILTMFFLSGHRGQTCICWILKTFVSETRLFYGIGDLLKTSHPGVHLSGLGFEGYPHDSRFVLCAPLSITLIGQGPSEGLLLNLFFDYTTSSTVGLSGYIASLGERCVGCCCYFLICYLFSPFHWINIIH